MSAPSQTTSPHQSDDARLVALIVQQDQAALSQLYDRYARVLYSVAHRSLSATEECEEVVLDVFSQVWRTADRYDAQKARVDTWLFMMLRSRVMDRLRKMQRQAKAASVLEGAAASEIRADASSVDPMEEAVITDRRSRVLAALQQIPEAQRQVIELAYYQGLSHSEIAAQTALSIGTVKTRIRLGLTKLKTLLGSWE